MINIAIVGTGGMANNHAEMFAAANGCKVVAVCDIDLAKAQAFANKHNIEKVYAKLEDLLADPDIDGVSNVTPDKFHKPVSLQIIAAGKHVLCEKPLAVNAADAQEMARAAEAAGVINMVNLSYRDAPAIQDARRRVLAGEIGRVMHVDASYLQSWLVANHWGDWHTEEMFLWRLSSQHGSKGVLGDVGIHILDFASYPVGDIEEVFCQLKCFDKAPGNRLGEYTLDANDSALIHARFANGAMGSIHTTRWATGNINTLRLRIHGDKGAIDVDLDRSRTSIQMCRGDNINDAIWETLESPHTPNNYQRFVDSIISGVNDQPDFAYGAKLQVVIDSCFASDEQRQPISLISK
jgi:predicted dehydrogenase